MNEFFKNIGAVAFAIIMISIPFLCAVSICKYWDILNVLFMLLTIIDVFILSCFINKAILYDTESKDKK